MPPGSVPPTGGPPHPGGPHGFPAPQAPQRGGGGIGLIIGAVALVLVLMAGGGFLAWTLVSGGASPGAAPEGSLGGGAGPGDDLGEVRYYEDLSLDHVDEGESVDYDVFPPVGGPHYPVWQNCGVYEEPLRSEYVVHALEHGAVWIAYDPELPVEQVRTLEGYYSAGDYLVVSPVEGLPAPVVATAWGSQIHLEEAGDPRLPEYLAEFVQGENTPEPGAPCSGGHSGTEADPSGTAASRHDDS